MSTENTITAVKERPILMSGSMVNARRAGLKTQTRRIVKPQPNPLAGDAWEWDSPVMKRIVTYRAGWARHMMQDMVEACPYGMTGDKLWVRETAANIWTDKERGWHYVYKADGTPDYLPKGEIIKWAASIHMPRIAARDTPTITLVRVERLQDISDEDCLAEGIRYGTWNDPGHLWHGMPLYTNPVNGEVFATAQGAFENLWDCINGGKPGCAWADNPWVWVIGMASFEAPGQIGGIK